MQNWLVKCALLIICIASISCNRHNVNYCEYILNDVPYRNISFKFNQDSTFVLHNYGGYQIHFVGYGYWKPLDQRSAFITINGVTDTVDRKNASSQGIEINADSAFIDRSYIFPIIYNDTIVFSNKYRNLHFKGYLLKHTRNSLKIQSLFLNMDSIKE